MLFLALSGEARILEAEVDRFGPFVLMLPTGNDARNA